MLRRAWCCCLLALLALPALAGGGGQEHDSRTGADPCLETAGEVCPANSRPVLALTTDLGAIEIELLPEAAPRAVAFVARLARGPIFDPALVQAAGGGTGGSAGADRAPGFYDGLRFEYTQPHVLIATGTRPPGGVFRTPTCIDAEALGLDEERITDPAEAMRVMQRELLREHVGNKKTGGDTPQLSAWIARWKTGFTADFLLGVSRRQIDEALGFVFHPGLASRPPERGAVALWPLSATESSPRLALFLTAVPEHRGHWMVIGRVVSGLETADAISSRPLEPAPGEGATEPVDPVVVSSATVDCRPTPSPIP